MSFCVTITVIITLGGYAVLYRIFGRNGSGKTHFIFRKLAECIKNQKHAFLIVPEQSAVTTEKSVVQSFLLSHFITFRAKSQILRLWG